MVKSSLHDPYCRHVLFLPNFELRSLYSVQNGTHLGLVSKLSACLVWVALFWIAGVPGADRRPEVLLWWVLGDIKCGAVGIWGMDRPGGG